MTTKYLEVEIFLDSPGDILSMADCPEINGFTSNPSLLKRAGIVSYEAWSRQILMRVNTKPVALEVMSDNFEEMHRQAKIIQSWGKNVNVKIPITNTKGESSIPLMIKLVNEGVTVNATAITTFKQALPVIEIMEQAENGFVSIFCGRIADTGRDPVQLMTKLVYMKEDISPHIKLIWASAREVYNVVQADQCGCDIITIGMDLFKKLPMLGTDLEEMSLNTVKQFFIDATNANYIV